MYTYKCIYIYTYIYIYMLIRVLKKRGRGPPGGRRAHAWVPQQPNMSSNKKALTLTQVPY